MLIYLETIENIKNTVLTLIEKERNADVSGQSNTETLDRLRESALGETDRLFDQVVGLPGDEEEHYRCRLLIIEALEDLRESFEHRYSNNRTADRYGGNYWQIKRAGYLVSMQAAEQEVRNFL